MAEIDNRSPLTGRWFREDSTVVNAAELLEQILAALSGPPAPPVLQIVGYEKLVLNSSSPSSLADIPLDATGVILSTRGDFRFTGDGTTPVQGANGEGHLQRDTEGPLRLDHLGQDGLADLQFIRATGSGTTTVYVTYTKQ